MADIPPNSVGLINQLTKNQRAHSDSLQKLSSGSVFTKTDPRPADRAIAGGLELKLRSLSSAQKNIGDAVSLVQAADSGFSEVSNILVRMKEISVSAASDTVNDTERRLLFVEYNALYKEVDRIAASTEFGGIPLLDGSREDAPESLILRVGDPYYSELATSQSGDINAIEMPDLKSITATTMGLGLRSVQDLLDDDDPIEADDARKILASDNGSFASIFDEALSQVTTYRAKYGAVHSRIEHASRLNEVMAENISAAKSKIADTDYASEMAKLTKSAIMMQASASLLAHANIKQDIGLQLIQGL